MEIRCGVDIVEVGRVERALKLRERFAGKVFTDAEIGYCEAAGAGKYEKYAARFAAKEAALKAMGVGLFSGAELNEIEVVNDGATGAPWLRLLGGAGELYNELGGASLSVSLSHAGGNAVASVAMLCGN